MQNDYTAELLSNNNSNEITSQVYSLDNVTRCGAAPGRYVIPASGGASPDGLPSGEADGHAEPPGSAFGSSLSTKLHGSAKYEAKYVVRFSVGGEHIAIKPVRQKIASKAALATRDEEEPAPTARKAISDFTSKSKLALKRTFARLDKAVTGKAQMVTLTYSENMQDAPRAKRHLHALAQRLHRAYPGAGYIWKMECQKRGAIHFHLLVFGVKFLPWEWIAQVWMEIVAQGAGLSDKQLKDQLDAGTQVQAAKSLWEAKSYLEKYLGKTDQTGELDNPGRWWGTHSLEAFKATVFETEMTGCQVVKLARTLDKMHCAKVKAAWRARHPLGASHWNWASLWNSPSLRPHRWKIKHRWMLSWARRRKKNVLGRSCYWAYDVAGSLEPLLAYVLP
jgi:hypothetical protein